MTTFDYLPVDFSKVEDVQIVPGTVSRQKYQNSSSKDELTKEQKRKKSLVNFLSDDFEQFHDTFDKMVSEFYSFREPRRFIQDIIGVPDYLNCMNCSNLGSSTNGNPICMETRRKEDDEIVYTVVPDTESLPSFCSQEMRHLNFPEERLGEVNNDLLTVVKRGYKEYLENRRDTYHKRRKEALENDKKYSAYVTEDLDEFIMNREEYTAHSLHKTVRGLVDPRDFNDFRGSALHMSWLLYLDDVLQEEYYPPRAEAYLRALGSEHQKDVNPGAGGIEFEKSVRDFVSDIGWPLKDRLFEIEGDTDANHKEMDIHTEIASRPTVIEVYTTGAHNSKRRQVSDYQRLYERATGDKPCAVHLTDGQGHCELSVEFFEMVLEHSPVDVDNAPGDHRKFEIGMNGIMPEKRGETTDHQYDFGEFTYTPPDDCVSTELHIEEILQSRSLEVSKPYSEPGIWTHAVGPTVTVEKIDEAHTIAFHGGRPEDPRQEYESMDNLKRLSPPGRWPQWLAETTGNENITTVKVTDEVTQNILSPQLLLTLLQS